MSEMTALFFRRPVNRLSPAAAKQLAEFRASHAILAPPPSLSPQPAPEAPMTPREARRARQQAERETIMSERVGRLLDGLRVTFGPHRAAVERAVLAQGFRVTEITEIQQAVEGFVKAHPHFVELEQRAPKVLPAFEARIEQTQRMNTDVDGYVEFRRRNNLEILPAHTRPIPVPLDPDARPARPEPPPENPADAIYNAARTAMGLPKCSKSSSDWWEQRQKERSQR